MKTRILNLMILLTFLDLAFMPKYLQARLSDRATLATYEAVPTQFCLRVQAEKTIGLWDLYSDGFEKQILDALEKLIRPGKKVLLYTTGSVEVAQLLAGLGVEVNIFTPQPYEGQVIENFNLEGQLPKNIRLVSLMEDDNATYDFFYCDFAKNYDDLTKKSSGWLSRYQNEVVAILTFLVKPRLSANGRILLLAPITPGFYNALAAAGFTTGQEPEVDINLRYGLVLASKSQHPFNSFSSVEDVVKSLAADPLDPFETWVRERKLFNFYLSEGVKDDLRADELAETIERLEESWRAPTLYEFAKLLVQCQEKVFKSRMFEEVVNEIDQALLEFEQQLQASFHDWDTTTQMGLERLANKALEFSNVGDGVFLKRETIRQLLEDYPPMGLYESFGGATEGVLNRLESEYGLSVEAVFSLARYIKAEQWSADVQKAVEKLTKSDFEKRPIQVIVFDQLPEALAVIFKEKLPFSNDKLAGTLTGLALPTEKANQVPLVRALTRALHYIFEITYYNETWTAFFDHEGKMTVGGVQKSLAPDKRELNLLHRHSTEEVIFMVEAIKAIEFFLRDFYPSQLQSLPFSLIYFDEDQLKVTSIIDRVTVLSKGKESELHARRYLNLLPIHNFFSSLSRLKMVLRHEYGPFEIPTSLIPFYRNKFDLFLGPETDRPDILTPLRRYVALRWGVGEEVKKRSIQREKEFLGCA